MRLNASKQAGLFACPMENGNPEKCICHATRTMPVAERIRILDSCTNEECLELFAAHRECFTEKIRLADQKTICDQPHASAQPLDS
jgi:hypothetical protein